MKTLTKKQRKALKSLIFNLNELDNKPRRLYQSLYDFADVFIEDKEANKASILLSIIEAQRSYYTSIDIEHLATHAINAKKRAMDACMETRFRYAEELSPDYMNGLEEGISEYGERILKELFHIMR